MLSPKRLPTTRRFTRSQILYYLFFVFSFACVVPLSPAPAPANRTDSCLVRFAYLFVSFSTTAFSHLPEPVHGAPAVLLAATVYPSNFTAGIRPLPLHSHNDYWRAVPFFTALGNGAISTEADVWHFEDTLYVGHSKGSLTAERTFRALYINPILGILSARNPNGTKDGWNGVFYEAPAQTLNLYIDLKTPGTPTLPVVVAALEPLRERGYLTHLEGGKVMQGAVTVHLTGDTQFVDVLAMQEEGRDVFFDAPLTELESGRYNTTNSLMATAPFGSAVGKVIWAGAGRMTEDMVATVNGHIAAAHERGIGVRYWDTPGWPKGVREGVWRTLVDLGVDLLNVDDLRRAADFV